METTVKGNTALKGEAIKPVVMTVSKPETEKKPETSKMQGLKLGKNW